MEIEDKHKESLKFLNLTDKLDSDSVEKLLENCCSTLSGKNENHDVSELAGLNRCETQQLYNSLLYIYVQCVRNSLQKEEFSNFLSTECNVDKNRISILEKFYEKWYKNIRIQLLNIGSHLPHITDVKWKIDYIVKSNRLDQSEGPIFEVSLKTEKYDEAIQKVNIEYINFICTNQELQDLVYKLRDIARHCQKLAVEH